LAGGQTPPCHQGQDEDPGHGQPRPETRAAAWEQNPKLILRLHSDVSLHSQAGVSGLQQIVREELFTFFPSVTVTAKPCPSERCSRKQVNRP
jgi:hypothetical protein